jgi:hypothetical protein
MDHPRSNGRSRRLPPIWRPAISAQPRRSGLGGGSREAIININPGCIRVQLRDTTGAMTAGSTLPAGCEGLLKGTSRPGRWPERTKDSGSRGMCAGAADALSARWAEPSAHRCAGTAFRPRKPRFAGARSGQWYLAGQRKPVTSIESSIIRSAYSHLPPWPAGYPDKANDGHCNGSQWQRRVMPVFTRGVVPAIGLFQPGWPQRSMTAGSR